MRRFYTWKDIEIELFRNRAKWPKSWTDIDVYSTMAEVFVNSKEKTETFWKNLFGNLYLEGEECIVLPFTGQKIQIIYTLEPEAAGQERVIAPLFKNIYLSGGRQPSLPDKPLPGVPVIAFHSYKGGVGRTLSLISFVRELTECFEGKKKALIIDADLEAPGLTWMAEEQNNRCEISYLDVLSLIHVNGFTDELTEKISGLVEKSVLTFETESLSGEHLFIPTYLEESQLMDVYASPEILLSSSENKFILPEFFSSLGKKLGADIVFIDLRAGVSEYSAPYIFDPRVKKFFVTSTSRQSVRGTSMLLRLVMDYFNDENAVPQILLTMIPPSELFSEEMENETRGQLAACMTGRAVDGTEEEGNVGLSDAITGFGFDSALIHLDGIAQVCAKLRSSGMRKETARLVRELFDGGEPVQDVPIREEVQKVLKRLFEITDKELVAEGTASSNMLCTDVIQRIARDFRREVPQIVVLGAKGSGKTYLYKQLLINKSWNQFVRTVEKDSGRENREETYIIPVLASEDRKVFQPLLQKCIDYAREGLGWGAPGEFVYASNEDKMKAFRKQEHTSSEWRDFWERCLLESAGENGSFSELAERLEGEKKRIVFILDGVETLFDESVLSEAAKGAIRVLCRDLPNRIGEMGRGRIGIVIFLRKDLAEDAITTNYEQFRAQFSQYELNWSQTEALRLALWIAQQAEGTRFSLPVPLPRASRELVEQKLNLLWGSKLGRKDSKEAYTSRWVIAALSDFNGQLQARDIVRFLKYSTQSWATVNLSSYPDRYIMPTEIKKAIVGCSEGKVGEIKQEIRSLKEIFEKLEDLDETEKFLPLNPEKLPLSPSEIHVMMKQGYLKIYKEQYYIPEIIRHHFGFRYQKGARPKVLALLLK